MATAQWILLAVTGITNVRTTLTGRRGTFFGQEIIADYNHGDVHILMTSHDVSLHTCFKRCFHEPRCDFINYKYRFKMCYLIEHFNEDFEATDLFSIKEGSLLGVKAEWQLNFSTAPNEEAATECGRPQNIPFAEKFGNVYVGGSKVLFRCRKSHDRNITVTCSSSGEWENQSLICYPDQCYTHDDLWIHGNFCYVFLWNTTATQPSAQAICERLDGQLPLVKNQQKQVYIASILNNYLQTGDFSRSNRPNSWVWIGLSDTEQENVFKWTGETTSTDYLNWYGSEPNGQLNQNCVVLGPAFSYQWADVSCNGESFLTMCEIRT